MTTKRRKGKPFTPDWMKPYGIGLKDWLDVTKPQLEVLQCPGHDLEEQVWATVMLHSAGYQKEDAVMLVDGQEKPLSPARIAKEIQQAGQRFFERAGIKPSKEQIQLMRPRKERLREAVAALELKGIGKRFTEQGRPLSELSKEQLLKLRGQVLVKCWLKPKEADPTFAAAELEKLVAPKPKTISATDVTEKALLGQVSGHLFSAFDLKKPANHDLGDPVYADRVRGAIAAAKTAFCERMGIELEVTEKASLDVTEKASPEVTEIPGAFEHYREHVREHEKAPRLASSSLNVDSSPTTTQKLPSGQEFHHLVRTAFAKANRSLPTRKQLLGLSALLAPLPAEAPAAFVPFLVERMPRLKHPGILPSLAEEFVASWDAHVHQAEAEAAELSVTRRRQEQNMVQFAREVLQRLDSEPEEREWANEVLATYGQQTSRAGGD